VDNVAVVPPKDDLNKNPSLAPKTELNGSAQTALLGGEECFNVFFVVPTFHQ
jgi:hypothetical protein